MKVYLIAGKAGSGKNEVARIIQEYEDKTIVTGLSKYIKLFAMEMTDWKGQDLDKPRAFLQNMGDTLRGIDEDFLIKRMVEDFKVYEISGIENVVISDVRLVHEVEYFKNLKDYEVITIRVNSEMSKRNLKTSEMIHHTETELDDYSGYDYVIENKFNKELKSDVKKILEGSL